MKALLVLLAATAAMADSPNTPDGAQNGFPVFSLIFAIIFGLIFLANLYWLVKTVKAKQNLQTSDIEKESLVTSTLPEGVVSTNIMVSAKNRPTLLAELRYDEQLVWANENLTPFRTSSLLLLVVSLLFAAAGFLVALTFILVFPYASNETSFITIWTPFNLAFLVLARFIQIRSSNSVIYAITSKRVFILSSMPGCYGGKTDTVRAYDIDGIHQTTVTRKEDGSGTLTFSAAALVDGVAHDSHQLHGRFAFANIPNVTAVKDLIEQYKTLRKKQAGNQ